jgi:hypothetical protein
MPKQFKTIAIVALIGVVAFVAYKKLHKTYDPIAFLDKIYVHVEDVSHNEHVHNHFYTVNGVPVQQAEEWIQITVLGPKVTTAMRDQVDNQIRSTMRVQPVEGNPNRLFGVMQNVAVHVFMMESVYVIYAVLMVDGDRPVYEAAAASKFEEMRLIPADDI